MTTQATLQAEARRLARSLDRQNCTVVFAESCTGGLIAATLAQIPGVSRHLCGSAVVYQIETKAEWLGVDADALKKPGPVSRVVAKAMAVGVLERTPHADVAASVTGWLGPDAPRRRDGLIYYAVAIRDQAGEHFVTAHRFPLQSSINDSSRGGTLRVRRQREAAVATMRAVRTTVDAMRESSTDE